MNWTWLTGRISEKELEHEHRGEWERLVAAEHVEPAKAGSEAGVEPSAHPPGNGDASFPAD